MWLKITYSNKFLLGCEKKFNLSKRIFLITVDIGNHNNKHKTGQRFFMLIITYKTYCMHVHNDFACRIPISHRALRPLLHIKTRLRSILSQDKLRRCTKPH